MKSWGRTAPRLTRLPPASPWSAGGLPRRRREFTQALKLNPSNELFQLEAAVLDMQSTDPAAYEAARQILERLRASPAQHIGALRALATIYAARGQISRAIPLAKRVDRRSQSDLPGPAGLPQHPAGRQEPGLHSLSHQLAGRAPRPSLWSWPMLVGWMNSHQLAMLEPRLAQNAAARNHPEPACGHQSRARPTSCCRTGTRCEALTKNPDWGDFDFMRLAFLSRALFEKGDEPGSQVPWEKAAALASHRPDWLNTLEKTAISWGWDGRLEKLLWSIAATSNHPQEALQTLAARYQHIGDTHDLYHAMSELLDHDINNSHLKNNWAMLSLLLQADPGQSHPYRSAIVQGQSFQPPCGGHLRLRPLRDQPHRRRAGRHAQAAA